MLDALRRGVNLEKMEAKWQRELCKTDINLTRATKIIGLL